MTPDQPAPAGAAPVPPGFTHGWAELPGVRMHYVTGGNGPTVVLLHGWPQTWYGWRHVMPALADHGYRIIAPDHRGLGDSSRPDQGYDRRTMATDLHRLLDSVGAEQVSLVGHDWGASVAYAFAAMHPDRVSRLVAIEGYPFGPWVTDEPTWSQAPASGDGWFSAFQQIPDLPEALVAGREREYLSYFYRHFSAKAGTIADRDITEYVRTYTQPGAMRAGFNLYRQIPADIADNLEFRKTLLQMPVLAIGGELCLNEVIAATFRQLATNVTGIVLPGAKHFIPEEQTDELLPPLLVHLEAST